MWTKISSLQIDIPYARHHNPLLITNRSWILTIHKDRIFRKNLLENKEMVFKNGVKNIQTVGYNGAHGIWIKNDGEKLSRIFYFDIQQAPSELLLPGFAKPAFLADLLPLGLSLDLKTKSSNPRFYFDGMEWA